MEYITMTPKMAQKGSSVRMFLMRMRVRERNCARLVEAPKNW